MKTRQTSQNSAKLESFSGKIDYINPAGKYPELTKYLNAMLYNINRDAQGYIIDTMRDKRI